MPPLFGFEELFLISFPHLRQSTHCFVLFACLLLIMKNSSAGSAVIRPQIQQHPQQQQRVNIQFNGQPQPQPQPHQPQPEPQSSQPPEQSSSSSSSIQSQTQGTQSPAGTESAPNPGNDVPQSSSSPQILTVDQSLVQPQDESESKLLLSPRVFFFFINDFDNYMILITSLVLFASIFSE